jgi:hypothetical protein
VQKGPLRVTRGAQQGSLEDTLAAPGRTHSGSNNGGCAGSRLLPLALAQFVFSGGARRTGALPRTLCPHRKHTIGLILEPAYCPPEPRSFNSLFGTIRTFCSARPPSESAMLMENATVVPVNVVTKKGGNFETDLIVPLYAVIFVLSVVGNALVLITLLQNRRMRTVTNVFLLNLVSSFLLEEFLSCRCAFVSLAFCPGTRLMPFARL